MKVVVTCDALISRDHTISIIETILGLYEDAEIYTIVHHPRKILGPVELRKVHSTYLSNVIDDEVAFGDMWWKKSMLIPGACKNLHVPCSVDLVINVSNGFSQGINRCQGVYQITYLVDNQFKARKPKLLREKIFRTYLEHWAEKKIIDSDELWVCHESSKDYWQDKHKNVSVMNPFFKATDFPLFPEATRKAFPNDFFTIDAESLDTETAVALIENLKANNLKFKFVGEDAHLKAVKDQQEESMFYGSRCSGELAPLLAACRGFLSFKKSGFPVKAIEALSTGTPVWLPGDSEGHHFLKGAGVFGQGESLPEAKMLFEKMAECEPKKLHAQVNTYHDLKFKGELKRRIDRLELSKKNC